MIYMETPPDPIQSLFAEAKALDDEARALARDTIQRLRDLTPTY